MKDKNNAQTIFIQFKFNEKQLEEEIKKPLKLQPGVIINAKNQFYYLHKIQQEFKNHLFNKKETIKCLFTLLFTDILRKTYLDNINSYCQNKQQIDDECKSAKLIYNIESFFDNNFNRNVKVEELAQEVYLSPRQLGRIMNEYFGMSFKQKLTDKRITLSMDLLRYTKNTIADISRQIGYNSSNVFIRAFKKINRTTPSQYRKKYQK